MSCNCQSPTPPAPRPRLGVPTTKAMGWALRGAEAVNSGIAKAGIVPRWWLPVVAIGVVGSLWLLAGRKR